MLKFLIAVGVFLLLSVDDSTSRRFSCLEEEVDPALLSKEYDFSGIDKMVGPLLGNLTKDYYSSTPNLMLSPFSIWSVLTLALLGAEGNTKLQLEQVLGHPSSKIRAYKAKTALDFLVTGSGLTNPNGLVIRTMNKAYMDRSLSLRDCLRKDLFKIDVVDFSKAVTTSEHINRDVSQATAGEIRDLVTPSFLARSVFILVNAIYFKGKWETEFDPRDTIYAAFSAVDDDLGVKHVEVPTMVRRGYMKIAFSKKMHADVLELPYKDDSVSMYIILPAKNGDITRTVRSFTESSFSAVRNAMRERPVTLELPKFDIKNDLGTNLEETLKLMGVKDMFDGAKSDFSDFSTDKIFMNTIVHQARVSIDEAGSVASAATILGGNRILHSPILYQVDRPFMFLIYNKRNGVTLFAGIVKDPTK